VPRASNSFTKSYRNEFINQLLGLVRLRKKLQKNIIPDIAGTVSAQELQVH
jgi:hypothetical protein